MTRDNLTELRHSPDLEEPIRTLPEAIADRLRTEWYVIVGPDSEAGLCWTREEAVRVIAEGQCSWALNVQWAIDGRVADASEAIARLVLDKLLDDLSGAAAAGPFVRMHVADCEEIIFEAIEDARAEAEHITEVSSLEKTGRV